MDTYVTGNTVRQLREQRKLTQAELAEASGVSRLTIIKMETGKLKNARSQTLFAIAKALGCRIDDLFFDRGA